MKKRFSAIERMLVLSVAFTMLLLSVRIIITHDWSYIFYVWNIFLAVIPFLFSRLLLRRKKFNAVSVFLMAGWLLFFPNAPYIITDIFHYTERPPVPAWYDLLLVMSGTWNGLVLGILSLMQVEKFLSRFMKRILVQISVFASLLLCSYGIFLGRFLRFNSWDIFIHPHDLIYASAHDVFQPQHHLKTWGFTFLFAAMMGIIYFTIRYLPRLVEQKATAV